MGKLEKRSGKVGKKWEIVILKIVPDSRFRNSRKLLVVEPIEDEITVTKKRNPSRWSNGFNFFFSNEKWLLMRRLAFFYTFSVKEQPEKYLHLDNGYVEIWSVSMSFM